MNPRDKWHLLFHRFGKIGYYQGQVAGEVFNIYSEFKEVGLLSSVSTHSNLTSLFSLIEMRRAGYCFIPEKGKDITINIHIIGEPFTESLRCAKPGEQNFRGTVKGIFQFVLQSHLPLMFCITILQYRKNIERKNLIVI